MLTICKATPMEKVFSILKEKNLNSNGETSGCLLF